MKRGLTEKLIYTTGVVLTATFLYSQPIYGRDYNKRTFGGTNKIVRSIQNKFHVKNRSPPSDKTIRRETNYSISAFDASLQAHGINWKTPKKLREKIIKGNQEMSKESWKNLRKKRPYARGIK